MYANLLKEKRFQSKHFIVQGRVIDADGQPFARGLIRAFDKDIRNEKQLGSDTIDPEGHYKIKYSANREGHGGNDDHGDTSQKSEINLRISAYNTQNMEIASSTVRFCATKEETIDLLISREAYHGSSEFDRLVAELRPLRGNNIPPDELTEDDITSQVVYT
jgi:hypothetical protein